MGIFRQIDRNQARLAFNQFTKGWTQEKKRRIALQEAAARGEDVTTEPLLGRKPNFQQWKVAVKEAHAKQLEELKKRIDEKLKQKQKEDAKLAGQDWEEQEVKG